MTKSDDTRDAEAQRAGESPVGASGATYPVLPLRDIVVFPHMVVPLFVGREKSIRALEEVMRADNQILLVTQREASDDAGAEPEAADEAAGAGGEAVAAVAGSNESERRRFADERTGRMDLAEYDKYHARRRASGLGTGAFQRWCCGRWGLGGGGGRVSKAFSLLGWLARMRAAEVVEEANRAAHGGALTEVGEGAPLSRERYAAAARAASELGVGRDDNPSGAAARSAVRVGEDDGGAQGGPRPL